VFSGQKSWYRWSALCLLAYIYLAVTAAACRAMHSDPDLIPVTVPELLHLIRRDVVPQPSRDRAHCQRWSDWRRHHQNQARQAHQRWNAYADATT
jgi:hypothetical protein